jgi:hypothetical protein
MREFEIRLNPFNELGNCVLCRCDSSDPDWGASSKRNAPELFLVDLGGNLKWTCVFCVKNYQPALATLIELARAAESYFDPGIDHQELGLPAGERSYQLAIKIDQVAKDRICGLCGNETVSSSWPTYQVGYPELFINESIVCDACGHSTAPTLNALRDLSDKSERHAKNLPTTGKPDT